MSPVNIIFVIRMCVCSVLNRDQNGGLLCLISKTENDVQKYNLDVLNEVLEDRNLSLHYTMATASGALFVSSASAIKNYERLRHAIENELPKILRELLLIKEPPSLLEAHLDNSYSSRNLRAYEWNIIRTVRTNKYDEFDVPLMYKIIETLNLVPRPTQGWDNQTPPTETEVTVGDDIERIRRIRNEIENRGNTNVSDTELAYFFTIFKDIARRLEKYLMKSNREFVSKIENIETCVTYNTKLKEITMSTFAETFFKDIELSSDYQYSKMPDFGIQEQIQQEEQEVMISKNNRENLLICDRCNFGVVNSFCSICERYFCKRCYKKMHLFKPHNQIFIQQGLDLKNIEVRCNKHELYLDLFCFDDDKPICSKCLFKDHEKCETGKLEDMVKAIDLNKRQSKLYSSFQNFISEIDETKETVYKDLISIEIKREKFLTETKNFEQNISTKVSTIKNLALKDIRKHERKMETVISEIDERKGRAMEMVEEFRRLVGISSEAERLVYIHKLEQLLKINHKNFLKMLKRESIAFINPTFRVDVSELHDALIDLGLRPISRHIFLNKCNIKHTQTMSFKLKEKANISFIRGCAVLPHNILCFTDDTEGLLLRYSSGVIKAFELPCSAVDVIYIGENRIAVSLRKRRSVGIITLNENGTEEIQNKEYVFKDIGSIRSLAYDGEHIIIQIGSFGFYKVDHTGNITDKILIDDEINIQYVSCRNDKIYYTKWDTNTITCCDRKGKVIWDFQDPKILKSPIGIAVDEKENVFATGLYSNNVIAISQCGKYGVELFSHIEKTNLPHVVDYSSITKHLLVCSSSGDAALYLVDTTDVIE